MTPASSEPAVLCQDCGSPLAPGQRYCLECGARAGGRSAELDALLARIGDRAPAPLSHAPTDETPEGGEPVLAGARSWATALSLPRPRISALLVLAFLGFGVLLGNVASPAPRATLAASARQQLKLVLPAAGSATPASPASPSSSSSSNTASNTEPPEAEAQETPAPAPPAKTTTTPAKQTTAKGGESEAKAGESEKGSSSAQASAPAKKLPAIKHVFVIMLSDQPYAALFGPESQATYVAHTLEKQGELLTRYDAVAHEQLANELALISGQGPTEATAANCATYSDIAPATIAADEQVLGNGCVYPSSTQTLAGQLTAKHLSWRAYIQGTDEGGAVAACSHPTLGAPDPTSAQGSGAYATPINPFVYFHSIIDTPGCATDDVGLNQLRIDLENASKTPSFSYIVPSRCHDANPTPCTPAAPAGVAAADSFLQQVVPQITASKAYKEAGLLVITTDEAPSSGEYEDSSACCGQPQFPNLPAASNGLSPRGGGTVGALLLSPYVKGASTNQEPSNHFALLRTIEDLFKLGHLGYAALPAVKSFEPAMFTAGK